MRLSVTEYAKQIGVTRQAVLYRLKKKGCRRMLRLKKLVILILYLWEEKKRIKMFPKMLNRSRKVAMGHNGLGIYEVPLYQTLKLV